MSRPSEVFTRGRVTHPYTDAVVKSKRRAIDRFLSELAGEGVKS